MNVDGTGPNPGRGGEGTGSAGLADELEQWPRRGHRNTPREQRRRRLDPALNARQDAPGRSARDRTTDPAKRSISLSIFARTEKGRVVRDILEVFGFDRSTHRYDVCTPWSRAPVWRPTANQELIGRKAQEAGCPKAEVLVLAKNQSLRQPALNLQIARAYLAGSDSGASPQRAMPRT